MKIAVIGAGNVGGALAAGWSRAGHEVILGVRDPGSTEATDKGFRTFAPAEAMNAAEVVLVSTPPAVALDLVNRFMADGSLAGKVLIDATNSVARKPEPYATVAEGLKHLGDTPDVVKCFNTTGFENMADPLYDGRGVDMFMAGDSARGKEVARKLALDLGFEECYDCGGDDRFALLEQFALMWINLAIKQGEGRGIAFKILRR